MERNSLELAVHRHVDTRVTGSVIIEHGAHLSKTVCVLEEHNITFILDELNDEMSARIPR